MTAVAFSLATRDDDAGIRHLLATNAMPGRIRVRFEREPDYFAGCAAMGPFTQVLVAKDQGRVVGVACRAIRKLYINGVPEDIGYLGQLRVDTTHRGHHLVARGFRKLRELHDDGRTRGYITTIVDGNAQAEGVLVRRARGTMPRYRFLEKLYTLAIPAALAARKVVGDQLSVVCAAPRRMSSVPGDTREAIPGVSQSENPGQPTTDNRQQQERRLDLLRELAPTRNLFPADDPQGELVAVDGAVAALNDQRAYKQTVIDGYAPALAMARPVYNLVSRIQLPKPGNALNHAYVTHFCAPSDAAASSLIETLQRLAAARGLDHLLLGFTESDPFLRVARRFKPIEYMSRIYTVAWDPQDELHDRLDSRPRALDIAAL